MALNDNKVDALNRMNPAANKVKLGNILKIAEFKTLSAAPTAYADLEIGQIGVDTTGNAVYIRTGASSILSFTSSALSI